MSSAFYSHGRQVLLPDYPNPLNVYCTVSYKPQNPIMQIRIFFSIGRSVRILPPNPRLAVEEP